MTFDSKDYGARRQQSLELFKKWRERHRAELDRGERVAARDLVAEVLSETGLAEKSLANLLAIFGYRLERDKDEFFVYATKVALAAKPAAPPPTPPQPPRQAPQAPPPRRWFASGGVVRFD